jgi:hypothetical protein
MATYFKVERTCEECGEQFWGTAGARCCSGACRGRRWRAEQSKTVRSAELEELCKAVARRPTLGAESYSKLLPRLFRAVAADLRKRGWDPIELLMGIPDEPVSESDQSPGGIELEGDKRRMWLHPPERELELLAKSIRDREDEGLSIEWHTARRQQLVTLLEQRAQKVSRPKGPSKPPPLPRSSRH